ncbi:hypothetical protein CBM2615_U40013 [Cupriavidus taiwanensis]|uniref:Uncharacterized protein n=1 Tax=Cupriavidus taiwanensis TaxID=164546 RepID=A0A375HBC3_9BURK|nr:hypothetical protein CBM2614_U50005 [Cupriavidus taiwanensis]SOZ73921.1 hypothetical protein CBM2615_U40013 [Cupriavidus taiwanensis]SOZ75398.1 hypothetical protein CBM2613_U40014 [Cupriavidus taiwanensis]SPA12882.1 hypothetical protein CBM2625_U50015 [Cupriavidus taiwanensis]SPA57734.1 hypothetical protein CBM2638_U40014 [Cupriavidus taiwanensis]
MTIALKSALYSRRRGRQLSTLDPSYPRSSFVGTMLHRFNLFKMEQLVAYHKSNPMAFSYLRKHNFVSGAADFQRLRRLYLT